MFRHNIGRDVSKYFYGGYALDRWCDPWTHTNKALAVVNKLRIGTLGQDKVPIFNAAINQKEEIVSGEIYTVTFGMQEPIRGV
jgi:hypothetical protein